MRSWLTKLSGSLSVTALVLTWVYFAFVVRLSNHPSAENYVYGRLRLNTVAIMGIMSLLGTILGVHAGTNVRRIWLLAAGLNFLSFIVVVISPKAVL
jgi:hypothetical protein